MIVFIRFLEEPDQKDGVKNTRYEIGITFFCSLTLVLVGFLKKFHGSGSGLRKNV